MVCLYKYPRFLKCGEKRNAAQRKENNVSMVRRRSGSAQRSVHGGAPAAAQKLGEAKRRALPFQRSPSRGTARTEENFNQTVTSPAGAKLRNLIRAHLSTLTRTKTLANKTKRAAKTKANSGNTI